MAFRIASSPFTHNRQNTSTIMMMVILACIPGLIAQIGFSATERWFSSPWLS